MKKPNEKGQILLLVSVSFIVLGIFVALAIDLGRGYLLKAELQRVVDAASIAAAKALKGQLGLVAEATKAAENAAAMNGFACCDGTNGDDLSVAFVPHSVPGGPDMLFVQVTGNAAIPTTFGRLLTFVGTGDYTTLNVSAFAEAGPERPVDLFLVLDRSGSMNDPSGTGQSKIAALKAAMTEFMGNDFTDDDRLGMTSFGFRGCGEGGIDYAGVDCTVNPDVPFGLNNAGVGGPIDSAVQALSSASRPFPIGAIYTNTMEALLVAQQQMNDALIDPLAANRRHAVLLVTDGQPTALRRVDNGTCKEDPDGDTLPPPGDGNGGGGPFPDGCIHRLNIGGTGLRRYPLDLSARVTVSGAALYRDLAADQRTLARQMADAIRSSGGNTVIMFAIAIGTESAPPKNRLDANAKCLLARITNDPLSISNCDDVYTTSDNNDTYDDLRQGIPAGSCGSDPASCLDPDHQQGKVYVIDADADVEQLLKDAFKDIAAILKLRLTV